MKPAAFQYHRPGSVAEALHLLDRYAPDVALLAGGQSLGPMLNLRMARPGHVIDLNDLLELDYLRAGPGGFEIGAMTRHQRVATAPEVRRSVPLLAAAASSIGHYAIRQRGTIGGSLVQADPAAQIPLIAVALDASISVRSTAGARMVSARDFIRFAMDVDLNGRELVTAVAFPTPRLPLCWGFEAFCRRRGDYALASVAVAFGRDEGGAVRGMRIAVGGVGPVPQRLELLETGAEGARAVPDWASALAPLVAAAVEAEDDRRGSETYRRELVQTLATRALSRALATEEVA